MRRYKVELSDRFQGEFRKLDRYTQKIIRAWIDKNLVDCGDPRAHGKGLTVNRSGQWRYRIGDYRIICSAEDERLIILALSVGHRSEIYTQQCKSIKRGPTVNQALVIPPKECQFKIASFPKSLI